MLQVNNMTATSPDVGEFLRVVDYTDTPGARYHSDGPFPGEEFRDKFLVPAWDRAVARNVALTVDMDGVEGYATSFLEEAFGGLVREHVEDIARVQARVRFISLERPRLEQEIRGYIDDALNPKRIRRRAK